MDQHTLDKLEFDRVRERLAACCACSLGRARVERMRPSRNEGFIRDRLAETTEACRLLDIKSTVPFGGVRDITEMVERARPGGVLGPGDLRMVADTLEGAARLRAALTGDMADFPRVHALAEEVADCSDVARRIQRAIDEDGRVVDDASDELRRLRLRQRRLTDSIEAKVASMLNQPDVQRALQDRLVTIRRDRPCIPVRAAFKRSVPGVVHDLSASGHTVFIEPAEAVELGDQLQRVRAEEADEIERILRELSRQVGERYTELSATVRALAILDFIFAKAHLSRRMEGVEPRLATDGVLVLKGARHPLIAAETVVPVTVWIGEDFDLLLITGPNTGGKTVVLKTMGLLSAMALSGLHIPAEPGSQVPIFEDVYADIGDEQSIEQSLSTFSSHMTHIARIARRAKRGCLVLLDEVGAGTDPEEGSALAIALLRYLRDRGALVAVTTHYNALKTFALSEPRATNAAVDFDPETLAPTYRLRIGTPGSSNALTIGERLGLPRSVIREARAIVPEERLKVEDAIRHMELSRRAFDDQRRELAAAEREVEAEAKRHAGLADDLERRKKRAVAEGFDEAKRIVGEAREAAREILAQIRNQGRESKVTQQAQDDLRALARQIEAAAHEEVVEAAEPVDLRPGDAVRIRSLGQRAIVLCAPDFAGRMQVSVGSARMDVNSADLEPLDEVRYDEVRDNIGTLRIEKALRAPREIQLRGLTVDEALMELDKFLDDAALASHDRVYVVHGKGTGALRDAVRDFLRHTPRAKSFHFAEQHEGGVGVTVVEMQPV
jgi:DNA mismatch repair protein MutS2